MTLSRYGGRMRPIGVGSENMPSVESPDNATPIPAGHMRRPDRRELYARTAARTRRGSARRRAAHAGTTACLTCVHAPKMSSSRSATPISRAIDRPCADAVSSRCGGNAIDGAVSDAGQRHHALVGISHRRELMVRRPPGPRRASDGLAARAVSDQAVERERQRVVFVDDVDADGDRFARRVRGVEHAPAARIERRHVAEIREIADERRPPRGKAAQPRSGRLAIGWPPQARAEVGGGEVIGQASSLAT